MVSFSYFLVYYISIGPGWTAILGLKQTFRILVDDVLIPLYHLILDTFIRPIPALYKGSIPTT